MQDLPRLVALGPLAERAHSQLSTALVGQVSLKHQLRVGVLVTRQEPHQPRFSVWAATALALDGRTLVEFYGARCHIEFLFRDRHQFTGLRDGQARAAAALDCQFTASRAPLNLARAAERLVSPGPASQVSSMASWTQRHVNNRWLDVFIAN